VALKRNEKIVAEVLKKHFGVSSYDEVDNDPPDIIMNIANQNVSIEITDLDENSLQGRRTNDSGYIAFINNLNKDMGNLIPKGKRLFISFYHFNNKVSQIDKKFRKYLKELLASNEIKIGSDFEDCIGDICFKIKILKSMDGCKTIIGSTSPFGILHKKSRDINEVSQYLEEFNLNVKTKDILLDRISEKNYKCKDIKKQIWLALYDNYYNKFSDFECDEHKKHYKIIAADIDDYGIFEKVFVVFQNEDVIEIT
jgi:hypothetical protein